MLKFKFSVKTKIQIYAHLCVTTWNISASSGHRRGLEILEKSINLTNFNKFHNV